MRHVVFACVAISIAASSVAHAAGCTTIDASTSDVRVEHFKRHAKGYDEKIDFVKLRGDFELNLSATAINGISFGGLDEVEVDYRNGPDQTLGLEDSGNSWLYSPTLSGSFQISEIQWDLTYPHTGRQVPLHSSFNPFFCNGTGTRGFDGSNESPLISGEGYDNCINRGFWSTRADGGPRFLDRGWIEFARKYHDGFQLPNPTYTGTLKLKGQFYQTYRADYVDWSNTYTLKLPLTYVCWTGGHSSNCWGTSSECKKRD